MEKDTSKKSNINALFKTYLISLNLSKTSIKNYLSDVSFFSRWFTRSVNLLGASPDGLDELIPFINKSTALEFKSYLSGLKASVKTLNRRLVTLRKFSNFLYINEFVDFDFAKRVKNISISTPSSPSNITGEFKKYLVEKKLSKNTIKNYLSDVNQFLSWLENNSKHSKT